jgi:uncharacterized lipoprotein YddW (UPF0748 family)
MNPNTESLWVLGLALGFAGCGSAVDFEEADPIPSPLREFRAAWVATVANIDWPSEPGLPVVRQKQEALAILDRLVELNMNAVVFQVRPQADALYESRLEPWSYYLTGEQGRAPDPYYDPLEFWVEEAHARGLELHTWYNPYRANHPANVGGLSEDSIVNTRPELVVRLGTEGYYWMDPALKQVQDHSVAVVLDVVRRYDIDGVHFDDYFYPYREYNEGRDFPDDRSWEAYRAGGGDMSRNDWRRDAVNTFIERLYREIKAIKPHVEFGISPFGIWRPGSPASIRGLDQYDVLYADARLWLNEGWVDYFTPQLYWPIAQIPQSFPVLLGWWKDENRNHRHLWPGTSIGRMTGQGGPTELLNQILITRGMTPDSPGICMFSMRTLQSDDRIAEALLAGPYSSSALIPPSPWLDGEPPAAPDVLRAGNEISWTPRGEEDAFLWVVYVRRDDSWSHRILPGRQRRLVIPAGPGTVTRIAVSAVDRCGNEGPKTVVSVR